MARGRKHRTSADKKVVNSVYTAILVNDTVRRRRRHSGSADMMASDRGASVDLFVDGTIAQPEIATSRPTKFVSNYIERCLDRVLVELIHTPVHANFWKS